MVEHNASADLSKVWLERLLLTTFISTVATVYLATTGFVYTRTVCAGLLLSGTCPLSVQRQPSDHPQISPSQAGPDRQTRSLFEPNWTSPSQAWSVCPSGLSESGQIRSPLRSVLVLRAYLYRCHTSPSQARLASPVRPYQFVPGTISASFQFFNQFESDRTSAPFWQVQVRSDLITFRNSKSEPATNHLCPVYSVHFLQLSYLGIIHLPLRAVQDEQDPSDPQIRKSQARSVCFSTSPESGRICASLKSVSVWPNPCASQCSLRRTMRPGSCTSQPGPSQTGSVHLSVWVRPYPSDD